MKTSTQIFRNIIIIVFTSILVTAIGFRLFTPTDFLEKIEFSENKMIIGNGKVVTPTIETKEFENINVQGRFDITLQTGKANRVQLQTEENLAPHIRFETVNNMLNITTNANMTPTPQVTITSKTISEINLSGKTVLHANNIDSPQLSINMNGNSNCFLKSNTKILKIQLNGKSELHLNATQADNITLQINGKGDVNLTGKTHNLTVNAFGNSTVHADTLIADNVVLDSAGKSEISVHAVKTLTIMAAGKSNVKYSGNPTITKNTAGESTIEKQ